VIPNIDLPPETVAKMKMRAYYNRYTREARGGQEEYWQQKLTEFDPELFLRWSYLSHRWLIAYDHKGKLEVITVFDPGGFGKAFNYVKYNSSLTSKKLRKLKQEQDEAVEKGIDEKIDDAGAEFGEELHHATRGRLISDSTIEPQHRR
jgi:hypothetical protein